MWYLNYLKSNEGDSNVETKYILKSKTIYGIEVTGEQAKKYKPIFIHNKTKKEITDFINLCNQEKLEPIHLRDVISDMLL